VRHQKAESSNSKILAFDLVSSISRASIFPETAPPFYQKILFYPEFQGNQYLLRANFVAVFGVNIKLIVPKTVRI
jgi:hypothetical protein